MMKLGVALLALCGYLMLPQEVMADSGSITVTSNSYAGTPGYANVGVSVTVTKTSCDWESTYCGWFPFVTEVEASQPCATGGTRYVGNSVEGQVSSTQDLGTTLFSGTSKKLCLYVSSNEDRYIAETVVQLNSSPGSTSPTAPPGPSPTANPPASVHPLTIAEARSVLSSVLDEKYGSRFRQHSRYKRSCYRYTSETVRCRVRWEYKRRYRYSGAVNIRNDPDDPAESVVYTTAIKRKRLRASPKPTPPPATSKPRADSPEPSCDPNYSGACLDPNASDYDCIGGSGNGPRYTGTVRVVGDDHYDLDRDGDGIGCEA